MLLPFFPVPQLGNFRVEPPGLFRGRGEHPKMGKFKRRIYPRDVTINVGKGVKVEVPEPYRSQGQQWKEVRVRIRLCSRVSALPLTAMASSGRRCVLVFLCGR